jgi:hypothetical protein
MNPPQLLQGEEVFRILVTNALYINNRDRNYLIFAFLETARGFELGGSFATAHGG